MNNLNSKKIIDELILIRKNDGDLAGQIIGSTLFTDDLYFLSLIDKQMRLIDGFVDALESRNLTCMGILLRVQLDNCMRTYAAYIAEDKNMIIESVIKKDIHPNKLKDKSGNKLTDSFLSKELDKIDSRFSGVYKEASGYIHHSEKSFFSISSTNQNKTFSMGIGLPLEKKYDEIIIECAEAFIRFIRLQIELIIPVIESKKKYDLEYN